MNLPDNYFDKHRIRSAYKTSIAHLFFCDIEMGTR